MGFLSEQVCHAIRDSKDADEIQAIPFVAISKVGLAPPTSDFVKRAPSNPCNHIFFKKSEKGGVQNQKALGAQR